MARDLEEALVAFLKADPDVQALVGSGNEARIYPEMAPQGTGPANPDDTAPRKFPRLTYLVVDWPEEHAMSGPTGFCTPRVQIDCWAAGRRAERDVKALVRAVRNCKGGQPQGRKLNGFSGDMHGVKVQWCKLVNRQSIPELPQSGEETPVRRWSLDFVITHDEQD